MSTDRGHTSLDQVLTDETAVLTAGMVLVGLPGLVVLWRVFDANTRAVFLITMAVGLLPAYWYRSYWPRRYSPGRALLWGLAVGTLVFAVSTALFAAVRPSLGGDLASILAFLVVAGGSYVVLKLWNPASEA